MEQLIYNIYKIVNSEDDKIYIGSTRMKLNLRFSCHKTNKDCKKLKDHFNQIGLKKFKIELLQTVTVCSKKEARIYEQKYIDKIDKCLLLNKIHAYSDNYDKTRDNEKKKKSRRDYYHRKKLDPIWLEKERKRNRERMREKRAQMKNK